MSQSGTFAAWFKELSRELADRDERPATVAEACEHFAEGDTPPVAATIIAAVRSARDADAWQ